MRPKFKRASCKLGTYTFILILTIAAEVACCPSPSPSSKKGAADANPNTGSSLHTDIKTSKIFIPQPPAGYSQLIVNVVDENGEGIESAKVEANCPPRNEVIEATELSEGLYFITLPENCFTGGYISASKLSENRPAQTKVLAYKRSSVNFVLLKKTNTK